jgi:hypothetical protein
VLLFAHCIHLTHQLTVITGCLQGHELTLRVLYRLYGEQVEDRDFFSSTTAASEYEKFLLTVVCVHFPYLIHLFFCKAKAEQFFSCAGGNTSRFFSTFRQIIK